MKVQRSCVTSHNVNNELLLLLIFLLFSSEKDFFKVIFTKIDYLDFVNYLFITSYKFNDEITTELHQIIFYYELQSQKRK